REAFIEAGTVLNGYITTGIYCDDAAATLYVGCLERGVVHLGESNLGGPVGAGLVGNLPEYLQLEKPLLILFSNGTLSERDHKEMRHLAEEDGHRVFVACWLDLKRTPVGRGILQAYFGHPLPPLPLLVWVGLRSGGQVFRFPSDQPVTVASVQAWIEKLTSGLQIPSTTLSDEDWKPRLPAYDFLSKMAPTLPEFTIYSGGSVSAHPEGEAVLGEKKAAEMKEEPAGGPSVTESTGGDLRGTAPRLAAREKQAKRHAEL
ncbi:hypothetical protein lerEdw1_020765, partial [Lerista edwardsae]